MHSQEVPATHLFKSVMGDSLFLQPAFGGGSCQQQHVEESKGCMHMQDASLHMHASQIQVLSSALQKHHATQPHAILSRTSAKGLLSNILQSRQCEIYLFENSGLCRRNCDG